VTDYKSAARCTDGHELTFGHLASDDVEENLRALPPEFPSFTFGASFGQWWKIHSKDYGPWFYASDDAAREPSSVGRFDLPKPYGTLYVGDYLGGVTPEAVREKAVPAADSQQAYNDRRLSQMPRNALEGERIADFTSAAVEYFAAPPDIAALTRAEARPWARKAHDGGFAGILYRLREDSKRRLGLALFGTAGPCDPPSDQPFPQELPVGLRQEVLDLFEGEYRGDPLPR
jgi:hypothetical protein